MSRKKYYRKNLPLSVEEFFKMKKAGMEYTKEALYFRLPNG